jgi:hypothetical protein
MRIADPDRFTPLVAQFGVEMAIAASELTRAEANELVLQLLEKYESQIPTAPEGDRYQDLCDVITGKPKDQYVRLYNEMKEELAKMGIPFD